MARPKKETDLKVLLLKRYNELLAELNMIDAEMNAIQGYLKSLEAEKPKRSRRPKTEAVVKQVKPKRRGRPKKKVDVGNDKPKKMVRPKKKVQPVKAAPAGAAMDTEAEAPAKKVVTKLRKKQPAA